MNNPTPEPPLDEHDEELELSGGPNNPEESNPENMDLGKSGGGL